jgi:hypothetical protein
MVVYQCDFCGKTRDCIQKVMEHKEYDFCYRCWRSLAKRLRGKGRPLGQAEITLLAPQLSKREDVEEEPIPGESLEIGVRKKPN